MTTVRIGRPDDWHVHLRDDDLLAAVVGFSARRFRHALVMPNLRPPIASVAQAVAYRQRILDCVTMSGSRVGTSDETSAFRPLMTLFASPDLNLIELRDGYARGDVTAVKFYPPGATTNSDQARGRLDDLDDLAETLTDLGMRLLVHAESTDPGVDIFEREAAFLETELLPFCDRHSELGVTVEHVSTRAGIDFVSEHAGMVASITPHHLARERSDILADGMRPDLYCKPVINTAADRDALVAAATSGSPTFFCGTDSAPHPTTAKYGPKAAAGIFNAPYGLEVVAEVFHRAGALGALDAFMSRNGAAAYGFEPATEHVRLVRDDEPRTFDSDGEMLRTASGAEVVFFGVEEGRHWRVLTDDEE